MRLNVRCMTGTCGQWQPPTPWSWELMLAHWMSRCTWASQVTPLHTKLRIDHALACPLSVRASGKWQQLCWSKVAGVGCLDVALNLPGGL